MPYTNATSIMTSRDHPFNQSSRPLLAERKPPFVLKKKSANNNNVEPRRTAPQPPHVDRGSLKVHGINDFDLISQQYQTYNTQHVGYPYGSPPSPRSPVFNTHKNDFLFSDTSNNFYNGQSTPSSNYYANVGDFSWKRKQLQGVNKTEGGPFIFGVHDQINAHSNDTVIINNNSSNNINSNKYSWKNGLQTSLSNSDTSSSSRDGGKDSKFLVKTRKSLKKEKKSKDKKPKTKLKKNEKRTKSPNIKCVAVGDASVGKTNLIISYLENRFISEHIPTASDIYNVEVMVNDSPVNLTLCDTAGQDTLDQLRELCYPDSDVFLLCFSTVKPETFNSIKTKWAPKFSKTKASLILVGTQADLKNDIHVLNKLQMNGEKPVASSVAWDFASSIGAKYIETSSYTQEKVKDVFDTAIWDALLPKTLPSKPPLWKRVLCLA